jgi:RNA polymerase sigma factor (sigma-70 family)
MNSATNLTGVIRRLRAASAGAPTDGELLTDYTRRGDQFAFATLVQRYSGLVLGVARRQLADHQRAEDVFQATFLALARSASKLGAQQPLANWLYTVALRQARKLRAQSRRHETVERTAPPVRAAEADPLAAISGRELVQAIDEELARLPDRYRVPVLLCCVRGLSREQVAEQLGWSEGMVKGRLERGRRRLAERLAARGLAPSVVVLAPLAAVVVPADLLACTSAQALAPWSSAISPRIAALAALAAPHRLLITTAVGCALLVAGLVGWGITSMSGSPRDPEPAAPARPAIVEPLADHSDPLPEGASLRFGTSRYRQGTYINRMAVSPDGKIAAVTSSSDYHGVVRAFDLSDGRIRYTLGEQKWAHALAFSPDGKTLVTKTLSNLGTPKVIITLIEAATGKELRKLEFAVTDEASRTQWVAFTPDGRSIALAKGAADQVVLVDLEQGDVKRTFPHDAGVYTAAVSPDGTRMVAGGADGGKERYFSRLWDVASGKELFRLQHGEGELRTIAFSPDGKTVTGGGDQGWARIWDVATGKELRKFPKSGYLVRSVAFAPDGRTLAVACEAGSSEGDAIHLYDLTTGGERLRISRQANCLHFSPDGKVLTGAVLGTIQRWDAATGKQLTPQGAADSAVEQIFVTRDARRLVTRHQAADAQIWDATTGTKLTVIPGTTQYALAVSPDGRHLVSPLYKGVEWRGSTLTGVRLRVYDTTTDQVTERFPGLEGQTHELYFAADGRTLLTIDHLQHDGTVRVWDFATGKERHRFRLGCKDEGGSDYLLAKAVPSPDGKTLAVTYQQSHGLIMPYVVRLWDVATGTRRHDLPGNRHVIDAAFSPDSRFVATSSERPARWKPEFSHRIELWDTATGKRPASLPEGLPTEAVAAAFAEDGRTLATATPDGLIQLWELATGTIRAEYRGHRDRVTSLAFAPDGRLFTSGLDTTVLAWDLRPPKTAGPIDAAWQALTKTEGATAFQAQGHLLAAPAEAIRLIGKQVKPVEPPDPKRLAALLADLDSSDFAAREQASKGLAEMGRPALTALREAVRKTESAEVRKRATDLIQQIEGQTMSARELREVRAVEVLAWIGTSEAKELLTGMAKGAASEQLTMAADAALKRLKLREAGR